MATTIRMRVLLGVLVAFALATPGRSETTPSSDVFMRARILQLEMQVQQLTVQAAVCTAQLAIVGQPKVQQDAGARRQEIEKEAGCVLNWAVTPPVCQEPGAAKGR